MYAVEVSRSVADLPAWIFASLCLVGLLLFAGRNGYIAWCQFVLSEPASSFAPLAGGCLGVGAVLAAPLGAWSDRLPYTLIPLVLDFGALPYFALFAWDCLRNHGPETEMTAEEYRERQRSKRTAENPAED